MKNHKKLKSCSSVNSFVVKNIFVVLLSSNILMVGTIYLIPFMSWIIANTLQLIFFVEMVKFQCKNLDLSTSL